MARPGLWDVDQGTLRGVLGKGGPSQTCSLVVHSRLCQSRSKHGLYQFCFYKSSRRFPEDRSCQGRCPWAWVGTAVAQDGLLLCAQKPPWKHTPELGE